MPSCYEPDFFGKSSEAVEAVERQQAEKRAPLVTEDEGQELVALPVESRIIRAPPRRRSAEMVHARVERAHHPVSAQPRSPGEQGVFVIGEVERIEGLGKEFPLESQRRSGRVKRIRRVGKNVGYRVSNHA